MKFKQICEVVGAKCFQGNVEGVGYDSTTLFLKMELDESQDRARGYATTEYKFGTSAEFEKLKHLQFPFMAECEIELTTTGRKDTKRLLALRPVSGASAAQPVPVQNGLAVGGK